MKSWMAIVGGVVVVALVMLATLAGVVVGYYNTAVQMETTVTAQYDQNQNNYAKMFNSLKESAQVPDMYIDGLKKVYDSAIQGRYGSHGAEAVFSWIQEQNPNVDSAVFTKLQTLIEANRNDFEANQKSLIDKKRIYVAYSKQFPQNIVLSAFGFPRIDLEKYGIVTSQETQDAFTTKKAGPISLKQ
jgi:hypothetical protein